MRQSALIFILFTLFAGAQSPLDFVIPELQCTGTLQDCIADIERQSPLKFSFKHQTISAIETDLVLKNYTVKQILDTISARHGLKYELFQDHMILLMHEQISSPKHLIVGIVMDAEKGEIIQEAVIYLPELQKTIITDKNGIFRVWVYSDSARIIIDKDGYQPVDQIIGLLNYKYYIFKLRKIPYFEPVVITPIDSTVPYFNSRAYVEVSASEFQIPGFGGETDALSNLNLKGGIQSIGFGDPGLIIRGGGPDQNFVLIDGIPVYNTFHLLGLYSIFNSSIINGIKLYKDAFPSKYGSRLSSVVDVSLNNGSKEGYSGDADLGIVSSGFSVNGPLIKDKLSFSLAGRRTYADLITYPVQLILNQNDYQRNTTNLWYYDVFAKLHYKSGDRSQIKATFYNGGDHFNFRTRLNLPDQTEEQTRGELNWRNNLAGVQWHYILSDQLFMTTQSAYSNYDVGFEDEYEFADGNRFQQNRASYNSGLSEFRNTLDFDLFSGKSNHILFGAGWINYRFKPFEQSYSSYNNLSLSDTIVNATRYISNEYYAYVENNIYLSSGLISLGLRVSAFNPGSKTYFVVQPRLFVTKNLSKNYQVRFSITDIGQFLHLIPNNNLGLPVDIWLPVTNEIEPLRSFQLSSGLKGHFEHFEFNTSIFAKNYRNIIEYKGGSNFLISSENWVENLESGSGSSFGFEISTVYRKNKLEVLGAYTLCRSIRSFEGINNGSSFYSKYDRPHSIRLYGEYRIDLRQSLNVSFTFSSGNPITIPSARYVTVIGGKQVIVEEFDEVNNYRLPATHHLDISYARSKEYPKYRTKFVIGIYNVYNQLNPFMVYIGLNELSEPVLKLRSYLPMMPMLKYHIEF